MMVPEAKKVFDEALEVAAFPMHEAVAEQNLQMASGMAHYAYLCGDLSAEQYTRCQQSIQAVRNNRAAKLARCDRASARS